MRKAWLTYGGMLLILGTLFMVTKERGILWIFFLALIFPFMGMLTHRIFPVQVIPEVEISGQGEKGETVRGRVVFNNLGYLPYGRVSGKLSSENLLTREVETILVNGALSPKGENRLAMKIKSEYAGRILVALTDVRVYDVFCLTFRRVKKESYAKMMILPSFLESNPLIFAEGNATEDLFQTEYDDQVKGGDYSEIFQYRDYEKGDSLHRIHWKLSSKLGELVVKEGSKPVPKSILLLLSTSIGEEKLFSSPKTRDAVLETLMAVSQGLLLQSIPHGMAFQDQKEKIFVHTLLEYEEDLSSFLPRLLSVGELQEKKSALEHYQDHLEEFAYDHVILITSEVPREPYSEKLSILWVTKSKEEKEMMGNLSIYPVSIDDLENSLLELTL